MAPTHQHGMLPVCDRTTMPTQHVLYHACPSPFACNCHTCRSLSLCALDASTVFLNTSGKPLRGAIRGDINTADCVKPPTRLVSAFSLRRSSLSPPASTYVYIPLLSSAGPPSQRLETSLPCRQNLKSGNVSWGAKTTFLVGREQFAIIPVLCVDDSAKSRRRVVRFIL